MSCSVLEVSPVRRVERRGPSSFLAMSYFICRSLLIVLASVRAQEGAFPCGSPSGSLDLRERNSAILEALLRARLLARKSDISLIVWLACRGEWVPDELESYPRRTFEFWAQFQGASGRAPTCADRRSSSDVSAVAASPTAAGTGS